MGRPFDNVRPRSTPTAEKSIAVTSQPLDASQIALRPSPQARSRARAGGTSPSSASTNWLGPEDQPVSPPASRAPQPVASIGGQAQRDSSAASDASAAAT